MPRVTKKMKEERLLHLEHLANRDAMICLGYDVNQNNNVTDEFGNRLVFGKDKKFVKYGDGPFRRAEIKYDPVNNYQMMQQMFGSFVGKETDDPDNEDSPFKNGVRSISLKDDDREVQPDGSTKKYVEVDITTGKLQSERYYNPTLAYLELMKTCYGLMDNGYLNELDELKHEMEQ